MVNKHIINCCEKGEWNTRLPGWRLNLLKRQDKKKAKDKDRTFYDDLLNNAIDEYYRGED